MRSTLIVFILLPVRHAMKCSAQHVWLDFNHAQMVGVASQNDAIIVYNIYI